MQNKKPYVTMEYQMKNNAKQIKYYVSPQQLRREEYKYIDKYRTNSLGLNRYKA